MLPAFVQVAGFLSVVPVVYCGRRTHLPVVVSMSPVGCWWWQWLLVAEVELEGGGRKVSVGEGKMGKMKINLCKIFFI
jgi:hypothetical protein